MLYGGRGGNSLVTGFCFCNKLEIMENDREHCLLFSPAFFNWASVSPVSGYNFPQEIPRLVKKNVLLGK